MIALRYTGGPMSRRFVPALVAILLAGACAEPPTKEHEQAEAAVASARAADAATYAPEDLQAAEAALQKYDEAVAQRDYRQALGLAIDARDHAYEAAKHAGETKAAAQADARRLAAEVQALSATGNARLASPTGPRLSAPAAERLRTAIKAASTALQEARTLINREDYRGAIVRLTPAVDELRRELPPLPGGRRGR